MTESFQPINQSLPADPILDDLLAEFANQLQAGAGVDAEAFVQAHPERAEVLRHLLPAMQVLAGLEHSTDAANAALVPCGPGSPTALGELGDFRIVREVGRGGMGVVYEAEQISLGRRVALKVLPFAAALDAKQLQRFKNEAQAAAHLHHNNIVPVHYVGCERGVHFYAMQFIEGHTLATAIYELRQLVSGKTPGKEAPTGAPSVLAGSLASGRWAANGAEAPPTGPYTPTATSAGNLVAGTVTPPVAGLSTERSIESPAFFRTVAQLGVQAAEALEHAHQLGIIHRDIKPNTV